MEYLKPLKEEEQNELLKEAKTNPEVKEKLVLHNLRFVHKVAKKYKFEGTDMDDIFQSGVIGLMAAIDKYDPNKGAKFLTYAHYWIKQSITRKMFLLSNDTSLDKPLNNTEDLLLKDTVQDITVIPIEEMVEDREIGRQLRKVIDETLDDKEKELIYLRYGFYGKEHTLKEIGERYHLTKERVRQKENRTFRKLRKTPFVHNLKKERYLDMKTHFYRSKDYSQPRSKTNRIHSSVESIVLQREQMREDLDLRMLWHISEKRATDRIFEEY